MDINSFFQKKKDLKELWTICCKNIKTDKFKKTRTAAYLAAGVPPLFNFGILPFLKISHPGYSFALSFGIFLFFLANLNLQMKREVVDFALENDDVFNRVNVLYDIEKMVSAEKLAQRNERKLIKEIE